ncbi:hypothetical protein PIB30_044214 [Stylosanthes scabra]|uniref:Uncharacterized protein n=1 Tax=Stylosanthes scabra TaxID=79078 RepID=A0ABU6THK7_9FABA|nr:hypothetical protein [Stylosanthes scabra]
MRIGLIRPNAVAELDGLVEPSSGYFNRESLEKEHRFYCRRWRSHKNLNRIQGAVPPACLCVGGKMPYFTRIARDRYEAIFGLVPSNIGLWVVHHHVLTPVFFHPFAYMGSGVVYYEYESDKEYDDIDIEATAELGTIKIRRYHPTTRSSLTQFIAEDLISIILMSFPLLCLAEEVLSESLDLFLQLLPLHLR